jgi:hypothetical protein
MDSAYVPALAAFGGSAVGGLTSLMATWLTQRGKDGARTLAQEKTRNKNYTSNSSVSLEIIC